MTDAEQLLWYRLRAHRFGGHKFKRQVPLGPYVVDFACLGYGLVIEVDGGQHAGSEADRKRDEWLNARGIRVLRFWNNDVLRNTEGVLQVISDAVSESGGKPLSRRAAHATLSPSGRGNNLPRA